MAADQRKKRFSASSIVSFREQSRSKKKKLDMPQYGFNMRSSISLQWDDRKKSVLAKREQIGLTWRDLNPFVYSVPHRQNVLADVFTIPGGIFELENLTEVLSHEVWETHLSKDERNLLIQYLPKGAEEGEVLRELFAGDNFHFGNSFLKWGTSLCSGNLHPDAVLHREQCFKTNRKAYYFELQKYHNDMIGTLLMWKDQWASSKDREKEFVQKIWRSRKPVGKSISIRGDESRFRDPEDNLVATSESCSSTANEKACSSDTQNFITKHGELQRRKGFMEDKYDNLSDEFNVIAQPRKGERLQKRNIQCGDGAKFMSYIKVSKEQHQRVKSSMKHSSNSLQSRSLNRVLGNLNTFHVQPFEVFEEEERQKLHDHWIQLAKRDLPAAFGNWRSRQLQRCQLKQALEREMEEKVKFLEEIEEKEDIHSVLPVQLDSGARDHDCSIATEDEEKEKSNSLLEEQADDGAALTEPTISLEEDEEKENPDGILVESVDGATNHGPTVEDDTESTLITNQRLQQQISSLSGSHEFHRLDLDSNHNYVVVKTEDGPGNVSEYTDTLKHMDVCVSQDQGAPLSSATNVWPVAGVPNSYFRSSSSSLKREYHPEAIEEQPARLIDLEANMCEADTGKGLLHTQPNDGSFFSSYPSQDRSELLRHFFRGSQSSLPCHPVSNVPMECGQFSGHFREQLHPSLPSELRQKRLSDLYMHQNIEESVYSDHGGRYSSVTRQEQPAFSSVKFQDWNVNTGRISAPLQSHYNGGEFSSQNWFSGEHRARGVWSSGLECSGVGQNHQGTGNRNNADQSLFSVLSQCNELRSSVPYDSLGSAEQFIQAGGNCGGGGVGGGVPTPMNVVLPPQTTTHPMNYLNVHEASVKDGNMGWMSLPPHQNSALQDTMEKPFLRSWNH